MMPYTLLYTSRDINGNWAPQGMQRVPGQPVGFGAAAAGSADGQSLQVVAARNDGRIYHTVRDASGNWQTQGMKVVPGAPKLTDFTFDTVGAGGTAAGLQVVGVGSDGQLYHTLRDNTGNWQAQIVLIPGQPYIPIGQRISFRNAVAAASADGQSLQVVGAGNDGQIYHTIRDNNGNWQGQMLPIPGAPAGVNFTAVGAAGTAAGLQVVGVGSDGQLYTTARDNNGNWQAQMVAVPGEPVAFSAVAAGSADAQSLQVVGLSDDGRIYHTIRDNGNWQTGGMQPVPTGPGSDPFTDVGAAGTAAGLQVVGVRSDGLLYYTIRDNNGNWQAQMLSIPGEPNILGQRGQIFAVAAGSSDNQSLQVVGDAGAGELYYTICDANGNWPAQDMQYVPIAPSAAAPTISAVAAAGTAAGLQVVCVGSDERLYHTILDNNGNWQSPMDPIPGGYTLVGQLSFSAVAAGSADGQSLQVIGVGELDATIRLYHTIRDSNGNWQVQMLPIPGQPVNFTAVGTGGTVAGLHVVGLGSNGQLYHTIRDNNGNWQAQMLPIPGEPTTFSAVAAGSADGQSLQVVGVGNDGRVYHTICDNNGNWQAQMLPIPGESIGSQFTAVAAAGADVALQVVGIA